MEEQFHLKLTATVVVGGEIKRAGSIVQLGKRHALDLLSRGKAVVATADDQPDEADPADPAEQEADDGADAPPEAEAEAEPEPAASKPAGRKK